MSVAARVEEGSRSGQERASKVITVQGVALSRETAARSSVQQVSNLRSVLEGWEAKS